MRGGTPYPRLANAANGGGRHSGVTRWGQIGFRSASVNVPSGVDIITKSVILFFYTKINIYIYKIKYL